MVYLTATSTKKFVSKHQTFQIAPLSLLKIIPSHCVPPEKTNWLIDSCSPLFRNIAVKTINFLLFETKLNQFSKFLFIVVQIRIPWIFFWPHCVLLHRRKPTDWLILVVLFSKTFWKIESVNTKQSFFVLILTMA